MGNEQFLSNADDYRSKFTLFCSHIANEEWTHVSFSVRIEQWTYYYLHQKKKKERNK